MNAITYRQNRYFENRISPQSICIVDTAVSVKRNTVNKHLSAQNDVNKKKKNPTYSNKM